MANLLDDDSTNDIANDDDSPINDMMDMKDAIPIDDLVEGDTAVPADAVDEPSPVASAAAASGPALARPLSMAAPPSGPVRFGAGPNWPPVEPQWPPTEEEKKLRPLITKFRAANVAYFAEHKDQALVQELQTVDRACCRFLLARKLNVDEATVMMKEAVSYRVKNKTDAVLDLPLPMAPKVRELYPHCYHHFDKEGRPVYWEQTGQSDMAKLHGAYKLDQLMQYHTHNTEYLRRFLMPALSIRHGRRIDQITSVLDLKGLGRKHMISSAYNFLSAISNCDGYIYPEVLHRMLIINAPVIFSVAWAVIRPWLAEATRAKINIIRGDGKAEIAKLIDVDHIPVEYGGRCRCSPNGCIRGSSDNAGWLEMAEFGLVAQLKAKAEAEASGGDGSNVSKSSAVPLEGAAAVVAAAAAAP